MSTIHEMAAAVGTGSALPGSLPEHGPTAATSVLLVMSPREAQIVRLALHDSSLIWAALRKKSEPDEAEKLGQYVITLGTVIDRLMDSELAL